MQLLENAAATAGALVGLILLFASVSGAHFEPVVTLKDVRDVRPRAMSGRNGASPSVKVLHQ